MKVKSLETDFSLSLLFIQFRELSKRKESEEMIIYMKISGNVTEAIIQVLDSSPVNRSADVVLTGLVFISGFLILGVNWSIIK